MVELAIKAGTARRNRPRGLHTSQAAVVRRNERGLQWVSQAIPFNEDVLHSLLSSSPTMAPVLRLHKSQLDSVGANHLVHNKRIIGDLRNCDGVVPKFAVFLVFGFERSEFLFGCGEGKSVERRGCRTQNRRNQLIENKDRMRDWGVVVVVRMDDHDWGFNVVDMFDGSELCVGVCQQ